MCTQRVKQYLQPYNLADRVLSFSASSATVEEAALAVGCEPRRIAKTLSFLVDGAALLIVMAGDAKIDNAKFKARFHQKAVMIPLDRVEGLVGYPVGGVCPFDVAQGVAVYLDESLRRFDFVSPAAGDAHSAVKLTPRELEEASQAAGWVDVGKGWQEEQRCRAQQA